MGPLGLYKPKSIAKEQNGFQIVDTPKTAKHPVVIGFFAIDHELNRTLLILAKLKGREVSTISYP
jgi:hypothetical protein